MKPAPVSSSKNTSSFRPIEAARSAIQAKVNSTAEAKPVSVDSSVVGPKQTRSVRIERSEDPLESKPTAEPTRAFWG